MEKVTVYDLQRSCVMTKTAVIDLEIPESKALDLAVLCKRISFKEIIENAENELQAYGMRDALRKVQDALMRHSFNPR